VSGAAWPRCFQPCFQAGDRPLTPSVAPRPAWISRRDPAYRRASAGSAAPSSKGATSTVQSAFHRQVPPKFMLSHVLPGSCFRMIPLRHVGSGGEPATSLVALPPRSRLPTLLRPLPLSRSRARPTAAPEAIHLMIAEGRAPLVDFCNRYDPRAQLRNRPNPAHHARGRPRTQLSSFHAPRFVKRSAGGRASRHSQPRFHGPEACEGFRRREAPPAAIARGGGFSPTRSTRTPHVASSW